MPSPAASLLLALAAAAQAPSPAEIADKAPAADWVQLVPEDMLVMDLAPDRLGKPRRVVIELMPPPFSRRHIANIRRLAQAHWWDGTSVNRVQDDYVVQWGDATGKKPLPPGLVKVPESDYVTTPDAIGLAQARTVTVENRQAMDAYALAFSASANARGSAELAGTVTAAAPAGWHQRDSYAEWVEVNRGWPLAMQDGQAWPVHCYGMVGVGRDLSPDTGSGAELYAVIGQAPRHLDRNIALVGRVVAGMESLSALPRGTGALGFYEQPAERTEIASVRLASELPEAQRPHLQMLSSETMSYARWVAARANRRDAFFIRPAGAIDVCNALPPVRPAPR